MTESTDEFREKILVALQQSDDMRREGRAGRMLAVSPHIKSFGIVMGEADTLAIKNEAYECYINGHYIATILLSVSLIEHTLTDGILESGQKPPWKFEALIATARRKNLFPDDLLNMADQLRKIRNPFTHRGEGDDPNSFGNRFRTRRMHPTKLLEEDAQMALLAMLRFFELSLKHVSAEPSAEA